VENESRATGEAVGEIIDDLKPVTTKEIPVMPQPATGQESLKPWPEDSVQE